MTVKEFLSQYNLNREEKLLLLDYLMTIRIRKIVSEINAIKLQL